MLRDYGQMTLQLLSQPLPAISGRPGLTQGVYGDRGNFELVAPAEGGGIWVFWFNADLVDRRSGPPPGSWSGGLHFAGTRRVRTVAITQVPQGPDFLEIMALSDAGAERYYWTPADGFIDAGILIPYARAVSALTVDADGSSFRLAAVSPAGEALRLTAQTTSYPHLDWLIEPAGNASEAVVLDVGDGSMGTLVADHVSTPAGAVPGFWSTVNGVSGAEEHLVGIDARGRVVFSQLGLSGWCEQRRPWPSLRVDAVAAARTNLDGGRIDVIVRRGTALYHGWLNCDHDAVRAPQRIYARAWAQPGTSLHRR